MDAGHGEGLRGRQPREKSDHTLGQHGLARSWRPDHEQVVPARRRDLDGPATTMVKPGSPLETWTSTETALPTAPVSVAEAMVACCTAVNGRTSLAIGARTSHPGEGQMNRASDQASQRFVEIGVERSTRTTRWS